MITRPPAFREGIHWRELSPEEGKRRWRFQYLQEVPHRLSKNLREHVELRDKLGIARVILDGPWWVTQPGYAWNGSSPKRWVSLFGSGRPGWIGTPDVRGGPHGYGGNLLASGWHDQARQFSGTEHVAEEFTIADIDRGFLELLQQSQFPDACLWYRAVRLAAPVWPRDNDGQHSVVTPRRVG